jgi:formylglycine-generating enzyme required for sulfatase activity
MINNRFAYLCVLFASVMFCAASFAQAENRTAKPRVAVFGFLNLTGDDSFDVPTETASDNLFSGIVLLGTHDVTMPASIPRSYGNESLSRWCGAKGFDTVLFGIVVASASGGQEYVLSVYDNAKKAVSIRKAATGSSVLDVFGVSDELISAVLGAIAGHHVGFGSLAFAGEGDYSVVIDGNYRLENPKRIERVVAGTHSLRVVGKIDGDTADLFSGDVDVTEGSTATVSFAAPKAALISVASPNTGAASVLHDELIPLNSRVAGEYRQRIDDKAGFRHRISPFLIGKYEVSYRLWFTVVQWATDPARGEGRYSFIHRGFETPYSGVEGTDPTDGHAYPVAGVSWFDCAVWCNAYSEMQGLRPCYYRDGKYGAVLRVAANEIDWTKTGTRKRVIDTGRVFIDYSANGYRLPTEGEWLYAASCGNEYPASRASGVNYDGSSGSVLSVADVAWFLENSGVQTHEGGLKAPNKFGIYDMSGNVLEWCQDWFAPLPSNDRINYRGASAGSKRVLHGGSIMDGEEGVAIGNRFSDDQDANQLVYGLRVVRRP